MAQVTVKINGYVYTVGCEDGQEAHLLSMVEQVERRITSIKALGGPTGEARLLVLASLLMADELHDLAARLDAEPPPPAAPQHAAPPDQDAQPAPFAVDVAQIGARLDGLIAELRDVLGEDGAPSHPA